jgi:cation diffusion facilitator family transporter
VVVFFFASIQSRYLYTVAGDKMIENLKAGKAIQTTKRAQKGNQAVTVGLVANLLLAALKISIGIMGHSPALLADGVNSTSDVAYYIVVSVFVRLANKPADDEHPYGHSQLESIGALVVGSFVITSAVAIFWGAINTIYELWIGEINYAGASSLALWVALFTVVLKIILTIYTHHTGRQTKNASITALAYDHRNDVFSASAAVIGITLGRIGYPWLDPLAGALVALVILRTGIEILRESTSDLMDTVPGEELQKEIEELLAPDERIKQIDEVHAHRFGPYLVINITVCVDGNLSVREGDQIATCVENDLIANISSVRRVHVHYHPYPHQLPSPCN